MDDRSRGGAAREHRESVSASVRVSAVGDEDNNDFSVVVTPSPDSTDSGTASGNLHHTSVNDNNSLRRPRSMHSRPSSIAKPLAQSPPRPRSDVVQSDSDLHENPGFSMQAEAPYDGPSNPSHPYQMYPQRAMSISTISATGPTLDDPNPGTRGPTHPYGLYPQTTPAADNVGSENIPVGFPGLTNAFPRRLGLDGDESGSLVGSVAHSEELPPYTRYPDNAAAPKAAASQPAPEVPPARPSRPSTAPQPSSFPTITPIPGAGGIGLATRDPEFASESSDLGSPRLSTRSITSDGSHRDINTAADPASGEKSKRKSWQQQATKRLWGIIPYWAVGLVGIALIIMGVILGAVIGTFLSDKSGSPGRGKPDRPPVGENSTQEVILLETVPSDLPDLEVGAWGLLPFMVNQAPNTCFEIPDQSQAWTCNTPMNIYEVDVQMVEDAPPTSAYQLKFAPNKNSSAFTKYMWGNRSPTFPGHETLRLVRDPSEPGLGPAWWVRQEYNKTVIVPEDRIPRSTASQKREKRDESEDVEPESAEGDEDDDTPDEEDMDDIEEDIKGNPGQSFPFPGAKEGDKAWICTWPDTVLEVFMYPGQNNTLNAHATEAFTGFPFPTPTPSSTSSATSNVPTGTTTPTAVPEPTDVPIPTDKPDPDWKMPKFPPIPPPYPKVIKVSERRVDGLAGDDAYCEQVEIVEDGKNHRPVLDGEGRPIRVEIPEQVRRRGPDRRELWLDAGGLVGRDKPPGDCGCVWMLE